MTYCNTKKNQAKKNPDGFVNVLNLSSFYHRIYTTNSRKKINKYFECLEANWIESNEKNNLFFSWNLIHSNTLQRANTKKKKIWIWFEYPFFSMMMMMMIISMKKKRHQILKKSQSNPRRNGFFYTLLITFSFIHTLEFIFCLKPNSLYNFRNDEKKKNIYIDFFFTIDNFGVEHPKKKNSKIFPFFHHTILRLCYIVV